MDLWKVHTLQYLHYSYIFIMSRVHCKVYKDKSCAWECVDACMHWGHMRINGLSCSTTGLSTDGMLHHGVHFSLSFIGLLLGVFPACTMWLVLNLSQDKASNWAWIAHLEFVTQWLREQLELSDWQLLNHKAEQPMPVSFSSDESVIYI